MKAYISRLIIGLVVALVGAALLLDTLHVVDTVSILGDWWPLLVVLAGAIILINDLKNYLWALLVIFFGGFLQVKQLGYTDLNPWQLFWPLVLVVIGVSIIFRHPMTSRRKSTDASDDIVAILAGSDHISTADNFTGARATAILGGAKIDLRKATLAKEATIDVFSLMGGVEIVVPRGVVVNNKTNAIMGAVETKIDQEVVAGASTLTIVGDVIMGGVEIKN